MVWTRVGCGWDNRWVWFGRELGVVGAIVCEIRMRVGCGWDESCVWL
jgi:hypothetical protein